MNNPFENFQTQLERAAKYLKIRSDLLEILKWPRAVIEFNLAVKMDNGKIKLFKGFRSQHNNFRGPYKGGIRFHSQVTREEVMALSAWMSLKSAVAGIPFGGGKGGVIVNPKELSEKELEKLSRAYAAALAPFIGPYIDVPAPDVGTDGKMMGWMVDEYEKQLKTQNSKLKTNQILATFTGKPVEMGGSLGRTEATGRGGVFVLLALFAKLNSKHDLSTSEVSSRRRRGPFTSEVSLAVQGFGNVGYYFAKLAQEEGFKIVALSDSKGGVTTLIQKSKFKNQKYNSKFKNLDVEEVMKWKKKMGSVVGFPGTKTITNEELLELPVEVVVPSAMECVITRENAGKIKARVIVEMANGPVTPEADEILAKKGVLSVPDILANSGGVTVSYFEWLQNLKNQKWSEEKVNRKLREKMEDAFEQIWQIRDQKKVDLRTAAYILAVDRITKKL